MSDQDLQREAERYAEWQREQEAHEQAQYDDELSKAEQRIRELEDRVKALRHIASSANSRAEAAEAELLIRECYGEWCGKSPTRKSSGLCPACEWRRLRDE